MQTFLPYPSFIESTKCLDRARLGKQRVEAMQIHKALIARKKGEKAGWQNHPATRMWIGCEVALAVYGLNTVLEWEERGYKNSIRYFEEYLDSTNDEEIYPQWLSDKKFHDSHKSNLLRKMPEHYGQFNWDVPNNLPYVWPGTNKGE